MAAALRLFLFSLSSLLAVSAYSRSLTASLTPAAKPPNVTVCDPARYLALGLDMKAYAYCDKTLPFQVRAKDLVDQMTLEEKAKQLGNTASGVERLGLPRYEWWSEALHGVSNVGPGTHFDKKIVSGATSFPCPIHSAAAFNETLWKTIGQVVSTEARAMFNLGIAGLTYWSPNINVVRDPRWGRALETPGEDPYVVGRFAVNYVRGLQDVDGYEEAEDLNSRPLKVSSCCKHYAAYDVDAWMQLDRYHFDARVTEQDMVETFLRPFEMCVKDGDVSSVMCSYNRINGVPACADNRFLSEKIRGEWGLHGYIVSDCDSIEVMLHGHKWLGDTPEDAVSQALEAGLDLDCGSFYPKSAASAVQIGRVKEEELDKALINLYIVLMRLGFFDGSPGGYDSLGAGDVCTDESIELAAQAAREGIVLLKNDGTLPLNSNNLNKIAMVGPHANATAAMIGNYAGIPCRIVSPLDAVSQIVAVDYEMGCVDVHCRSDRMIYKAAMAAKHADATLVFVGLDLSVEAESLDRTDLWLPGYQNNLVSEVAASASGPVVVVIFSAGGIDVSAIHNNPKISAIVWAGYPGEEGGIAVSDVIFGKYNPGGRLPLTWYYGDYTDKLPMTSMQLRPDDELGYPGRTYKFFNESVLYPFGYGLSYTTFTYKLTSATRSYRTKLSSTQHCIAMNHTDEAIVRPCPAMRIDDLGCDDEIEFEMEVSNTGKMDGPHVLIVYSVPPAGLLGAPAKQVVRFERVFVPAGGRVKTSFGLNVCKSFSVVKNNGYVVLPSGEHTVVVGDGEGSISFPVQVSFE